jgi:nucleotide-binding universal stress UspA family protein
MNQLNQVTEPINAVKADKKISLINIMLLTDFSDISDLALRYALALARRYDSRIYLTHVIDPASYQLAEPALAELTYQKLRQAGEQGVADILVSGKLRDVEHEVLLREGSIWPTVERLIREYHIDFLVTGTHGRGQLKKVLLGSVAEEVFRQADCAVLTVGPHVKSEAPHEVELKNILFATDFGAGATHAAEYAFSLAQEHGARVIAFHAVDSGAAHTSEGEKKARQVAIDRMKEFVCPECDDWCKTEFRVSFGDPAGEILQAARESKAELIVMGAKSRRSLAGHMPLTVAYNVAAKAACPVLTVRG